MLVKNKMKNLLIVGKGDTDYSNRNIKRMYDYAKTSNFNVQSIDYSDTDLISDSFFKTSDSINIINFFPFTFWNENCEVPLDSNLYGTSKKVFNMFNNYFFNFKKQLMDIFPDKKINWVIDPDFAGLDRDKIATIKKLRESNVITSAQINYTSLDDILKNITPERGVFIKCRYGAEGKGITYLNSDRWKTNYGVTANGLSNQENNSKWEFSNITGRKDLLNQLLNSEVIVEKEIVSSDVINNQKFDMRIYVINGSVPHSFLRYSDSKNIITNFSQGAKISHNPEKFLSKSMIEDSYSQAIISAKAFNSNFLGVDVMFDNKDNKSRVVEVQTFTDFPDIRKFDLAKYFISEYSKSC